MSNLMNFTSPPKRVNRSETKMLTNDIIEKCHVNIYCWHDSEGVNEEKNNYLNKEIA